MDYLLKASAVITLFYLCYILFLKRETFFENNRWFLLIGLIFALVFPLVTIPIYLPAETSTTNEIIYYIPELTKQTANQQAQPFDWFTLTPVIYGIGVLVFSIQFLLQFGSLILLLLSNPKQKDGFYTYIIVKRKLSPFSFFKWIVYNPNLFSTKELQLIINHEKVHVRQFHSIDIIITRLACVIFWWNPVVWFYKKDIEQNLEYIADYKTQNITVVKTDYQHLLLKTSIGSQTINLTNNFYNSLIKKRILMLNKSRSKSILQVKSLLVLPLLAALLMSVNTEEIYVEAPVENNKNNFLSELLNYEENETKSPKLIEIIFTKHTSKEALNKIEDELKALGIEMTIHKIKRNQKGVITKINISFKGENGTTNYNVKQTDGITPFQFKQDEYGFGVSSINEDYNVTPTTKVINDTIWVKNFNKVYTSSNIRDTLRFKNPNFGSLNTFGGDTIKGLSIIVNDPKFTKQIINNFAFSKSNTVTVKGSYSYFSTDTLIVNKPVVTSKMKNNSKDKGLTYFVVEPITKSTEASDKINTYLNTKDKPLFIVDKKIVSQVELKKLDQKKIKALTVLKGEKAIEVYGDRAKYGAIVVETMASSKNAWAFSTGVKAVSPSHKETDKSKKGFSYKITDVQFIPDSLVKKENKGPWDFQISKVESLQNSTIEDVNSYVNLGKKSLIIVNDEVVINTDALSGIDPNTIKSMNVVKGEAAVKLYGEKAKDGVIIIFTKNNTENYMNGVVKDAGIKEVNSLKFIDDKDSKKNAILFFVSQNATDSMLDSYKRKMKEDGITAKYSKLKRNSEGKIIQIKISIKDESGNETSATFEDTNGIKTIRFGKSENGLVVNTKPI